MPQSPPPSPRKAPPAPRPTEPAAPALAAVPEKIGESKEQLAARAEAFKKRHGRTPPSSNKRP